MRCLSIGACILLVASTALAAPKHKKKKPKDDTTEKDTKDKKDKGGGAEIEMDGAASTTVAAPLPGTETAVVAAPLPGAPPSSELSIDSRPLTIAKDRLEFHGGI